MGEPQPTDYREMQKAFDATCKEIDCHHYEELAQIIISLHDIGVTDWRELKRRAILAMKDPES